MLQMELVHRISSYAVIIKVIIPFAILLTCTTTAVVPGSGSNKLQQNLIYDLTWPINQVLSGDDRYRDVVKAALNQAHTYLYSSGFGNETFSLLQNVTQLVGEIYGEANIRNETPSILIHFGEPYNEEDMAQLEINWESLEPITGITANWNRADIRCDPADSPRKAKETLEFLKQVSYDSEKQGVAYLDADIGCFSLLETAAEGGILLMLTIDFKVDEGHYHAQHIFNDLLSSKILENRQFLDIVMSVRFFKIIYNLRLVDTPQTKVTSRHLILFHKLAESWAKEHSQKVVVSSLNSEFAMDASLHLRLETEIYPKTGLVPYVGLAERQIQVDEEYASILPSLLCKIATKFEAVELDDATWNYLSSSSPISCDGIPLNLKVYHVNSPQNGSLSEETSETTTQAKSSVNGGGCHIKFGNLPESGSVGGNQVGSPSLANITGELCPAALTEHSTVIWEFDLTNKEFLEVTYSPKYYTDRMHGGLTLISSEIEELRETHPGSTVVVKVAISDWPTSTQIYCSPYHLKRNQLLEAIINWGYVHNITLFFRSQEDAGFWSLLNPRGVTELGNTLLQWPTFVTRNYPQSLGGFYPWDSEPCVEYVYTGRYDYDKYQVADFAGKFTGATLNMTVRNTPLNSREIQTLVQFAFHKFSSMEIVVGSLADGQTLVQALSPEFVHFLEMTQGCQDNPKVVYLAVPEWQTSPTAFLHVVTSLRDNLNNTKYIKLGGVHVPKSADLQNENGGITQFGMNFRDSGINAGLDLNNCADFATALLNSTSISQGGDQLSPEIRYLVCSIPSQTYFLRANYLDAHVYLSKVLKNHFPAVDLFFRTSNDPSGFRIVEITSVDISGVNMTARFAKEYELNYFLVEVVAHQLKEPLGWWRVSNYSDLSNVTVYADGESEFFGKPTFTPIPFNWKDTSAVDSNCWEECSRDLNSGISNGSLGLL